MSNFHIWQPQLAQERLKWKSKQPLYVLALRAYRLPEPVEIQWRDTYGGCRSWIELVNAIEVADVNAAISDADYAERFHELSTCLAD